MPRVIETNITEEDIRMEGTLRPQSLDDYIGQEKAKQNLAHAPVPYGPCAKFEYCT